MSLTEEEELAIVMALSMEGAKDSIASYDSQDNSQDYGKQNYDFGNIIDNSNNFAKVDNFDSESLRMQQYYEYEESLKKDQQKERKVFEDAFNVENSYEDEEELEKTESSEYSDDEDCEEQEDEEDNAFYNADILESQVKILFYDEDSINSLDDPVKKWIINPITIFSDNSSSLDKINIRIRFNGIKDQKPIDLLLDPGEKIINIVKFVYLVTKKYNDEIDINLASSIFKFIDKDKDTLRSRNVKDRSLIVVSFY